uniref:XRN 5'-3' exonuclease-like protein n=1 Tax=Megaviridae environmental sample TaxID=1737588 RepID=A0A5J6VLA6_9VIRU|nr:MAG: XRN 5'-3' exonuclease-like protein [Megaviridae environmental sample]
MGVPGFFLWLLRRYKKTNFIFDKSKLDSNIHNTLFNQVNNLDYILIDANCLIHPVCFQVLKDYPDIKNTGRLQKKMYNEVILYIEKIINFVKPKKGVYLAIDGVAPIAKMKQQRTRRYKSVHDNNLWNNIRRKHGKEIPFFWNNSAISPGTVFMSELDDKIQQWAKKFSNDNTMEIIYSSCNTPSEGEHKLLQFIRNNHNHNKNFSYITYGLDADLIFLMLATGIKDTFLLREAYNLDKNSNSDELRFVSMNIMREAIIKNIYNLLNLDQEIKLDEERLINDFIFICYLLGNDFLPHLPSLDIYNNGIDYLLKIYVDILENNNYNYLINKSSNNKINQEFFNKFIYTISLDEESILKKKYNQKKRFYKCDSDDPYDIEIHRIENLQFKIKDPIKLGSDSLSESRIRYYQHYYNLETLDIDEHVKNMASNYIIGLKWVTEYYFDKCPAWKWYYPYDIPPFITDINKFKINFDNIHFNLQEPLSQLEQLLCILPPQSNYLLPKCLKVITNDTSLYPTKFELDYLYKKKYWMTTPVLPELNVLKVKKKLKKYKKNLSSFDKTLNRDIPIYIYKNNNL